MALTTLLWVSRSKIAGQRVAAYFSSDGLAELGAQVTSPLLNPRCRQPLLPVRDGFLCWRRLRGAASHCLKLLVIACPAGRDDRQPPGMQELPQPPVAGRIMRCVHGLVVLAEELAAFLLRQVPEDDLRVTRILYLNRLSGHAFNVHRAFDAGPRRRGRIACGSARGKEPPAALTFHLRRDLRHI